MITNLLTNAICYNKPRGEVQISTRADAAFTTLIISDTGIGIGPADLPSIFDRFYRVDKSRSRAKGGSGLGLSICKAIVDSQQGKLDAASIPNEVTTFTVRLPRRE